MEDNFTWKDFLDWVKLNIPDSDWVSQLPYKDVDRLREILRLSRGEGNG